MVVRTLADIFFECQQNVGCPGKIEFETFEFYQGIPSYLAVTPGLDMPWCERHLGLRILRLRKDAGHRRKVCGVTRK